VRNRVNS